MAQSLNKTVELHTTGVSYMAIGGKVGKFLIGDMALEFYPDVNVEQYIQIPWTSITQLVQMYQERGLVVTLRF